MTTSRDRALAALKTGDVNAADTILAQALADAEKDKGANSIEVAQALADLAGLALQTRRVDRAEEYLRRALEVRATVHGRESAEYALVQAGLGEVLAAKGALADAELLVEAAEQQLARHRHRDWPAIVSLRAVLRYALHGDEKPLFDPFEAMDRTMRLALVQLSLQRAAVDAPQASLALLVELRERIEDGDDPDWDEGLVPILEAIAQLAGAVRKNDQRLEALDRLIERADARRNGPMALELALARGATLEAMGDAAGCDAQLDAAAERAAKLDPAARSHVLRARGVTADARKQPELAEQHLLAAVKEAEASGHPLILALGRAALGIFEQHRGRNEEAKTQLTQSLSGLPAGHPDQRMVSIHLDALSRNGECGCRDGRFALARRIESLAAPMLPQGLVRSVHVLDAANMKLDVVLARPPSEAEGQQIQRALEAAVSRLRPPAK